MPVRRHGLLIGVNRYPRLENADLRGCVNDVTLMASILADDYGFPVDALRVLRDEEATECGVRDAMEALEAEAGAGDVVAFFYSGHGSRVRAPGEPAAYVESIVPHDSGRGEHPNRDILDHEIDAWVRRLNRVTPHVTLILDCCYSAVLTRDPFGESVRSALPDEREAARPSASLVSNEPVRGRREAVLVAACQGHELAYEYRIYRDGEVLRHGAMTYFLTRALREARGGATWRQLFTTLQPALTAEYPRQHPQLEGRLDSVVFGVRERRPRAHLRVLEVDGGDVELAGGAAHGVTEGSLWRIQEPRPAGRDAPALATARIVAVAAATSRGRIVEPPASELRAGLWAVLSEHRLPAPVLRVGIDLDRTEEGDALRASLEASGLLELADVSAADLLVRSVPPRDVVAPGDPCPALGPLGVRTWSAVGRDGRLAVRARPAVSGSEWKDLVGDLEGLATYRRLLALENPDPSSRVRGRVDLRLLRRGPGGDGFVEAADADGSVLFREGEKAEIEVHNRHSETVWVSLLQFGAAGGIELLVPRSGHPSYRGGGVRLESGELLRVAAGYYRQHPRFASSVAGGLTLVLPAGFPWAAEESDGATGVLFLKLLVTLRSASFEFLEMDSTRSGVATHPLQKLVDLYLTGTGSRSFAPRPSAAMDWTAVTRAVELRRS